MKLYSYWRSSSSYRVRIVLGLKGVEYEYVAVDVSPDVHAQDDAGYESVNPLRQVPVLAWTEGGVEHRLTQSVAIVEYLEERFSKPALMPADAQRRARVREAVEVVNAGVQPLQNVKTLQFIRSVTSVEGAEEWARHVIRGGLSMLEHLAGASPGPYFLGEHVTLADVFIVPQLYNARRFAIDPAEYPRLSQIEASASELRAFREAAPDRQPDAPASESRTAP